MPPEGLELQPKEGSGPLQATPSRPPMAQLPPRPSFSDRLPTRPSELLKARVPVRLPACL